jgi:hypothetical protein
VVERQPSKLRVAGSNPVSRSSAHVAQSVEHILGKDEVTGSIPVMGSVIDGQWSLVNGQWSLVKLKGIL